MTVHAQWLKAVSALRIDLSVPGGKLVVGRDPDEGWARGDLYGAVKAAFREARRQLEDHVRRIDGRVKAHAPPAPARVARLFPEEGYGFLETADGREVSFQERSALRGAFPRLRVGSPVRYAEERIIATGPFSNCAELYHFGPLYVFGFLAFLAVSLYLVTLWWRRYRGGFAFVVVAPMYYAIFIMHYYPLRHSSRWILASALVC